MSRLQYLLDTNILVHLARGSPIGDRIDRQFGLRSAPNTCVISVVTVGEKLSFALKNRWSIPNRTRLEEVMNCLLRIDIGSQAILEAYAQMDAFSEVHGRPIGKNDLWIAATCMTTGLTSLTTDKDFDFLHAENRIRRIRLDGKTGLPLP